MPGQQPAKVCGAVSDAQDCESLSSSDCSTKRDRAPFARLRLGDIALVGTEDRLDLSGKLGAIFVGRDNSDFADRSRRLLLAVEPLSGWDPSALKLLRFLQNAESEYKEYVKNCKKRRKSEVNPPESETKDVQDLDHSKLTNDQTLMEYFEEKLNESVPRALVRAHAICYDLPSSYLDEASLGQVEEFSSATEDLMELVSKASSQGLSSDMLRSCFSGAHKMQKIAKVVDKSGKKGNCGALKAARIKELLMTSDSALVGKSGAKLFRQEFARLITVIQDALTSEPGFIIPSLQRCCQYLIARKCIESAKLVVATVSSSGKSIIQRGGSFELVLIDEAAQLVEAETAIAYQTPRLKQLVLVDDPQQLPPSVIS
eukprot:jgi/Mesen1/10581/ME000085S09916